MSLEAQPFSTDELTLGMYVSKLDRPWLETPFLFQGFYIEHQEVIDELRRYCSYVYVDVERSDYTITLAAGPAAGEAHLDQRSKNRRQHDEAAPIVTTSSPVGENNADDTVLLKAELINARDTHEKAERVIEELFEKVRSGETVEISSIQRSLEPMIESIMRNEDAMSWLARMKKKHDYVYDHSIASSVWAPYSWMWEKPGSRRNS
jgi:hypothetical protein